MAQEAAVPIETIREMVRQLAAEEVRKFARSSFLNNASITGGAGLSIRDGGRMLVEHPDGKWLMMMGAYNGSSSRYYMPDGSPQPMALIYRADGSLALGMFDPDTSDGLQQFLAMFDRAGNVIVSDDAVSGQGLARPYVPIPLYPVNFGQHAQTISGSWTTLWRGTGYKQHPQLHLAAGGVTDAGTTGQLRVLVNGTLFGAVQPLTASPQNFTFGPTPIGGAHESILTIEVQVQRISGTGTVYCLPSFCYGLQS